jgi:hypothetical protein
MTNFKNRALGICHAGKRSHMHVVGWNETFDELSPNVTRIAKEHIA